MYKQSRFMKELERFLGSVKVTIQCQTPLPPIGFLQPSLIIYNLPNIVADGNLAAGHLGMLRVLVQLNIFKNLKKQGRLK